jgi:hypothetical protein
MTTTTMMMMMMMMTTKMMMIGIKFGDLHSAYPALPGGSRH